MADLYALQLDVFKSAPVTAFYVVAVTLLGAHLWYGWEKTVNKFKLDKTLTKPVATLGQYLVIPVTAGFVACALGAHLLPQLQH